MSKTSLHSFYPSPINTFPIHANSGLRCDMPKNLRSRLKATCWWSTYNKWVTSVYYLEGPETDNFGKHRFQSF